MEGVEGVGERRGKEVDRVGGGGVACVWLRENEPKNSKLSFFLLCKRNG